ncbi:MarR family transcriptional regulator [Lapillicoccus sp.]|uniref:MarR family winged helix-turn-helix transcriptional regulator n=1 Tax=Lapillicoccus sp. TaxID=1909287 RepID=UPI003263B2A0
MVDFEQAAALNTAIRSIGIRHRALADALLAPLGVHTGQEVILLELDAKGPRSQGQLAISSGCEPPTITGSVRKLESAGLVVRRPSSTDGRVTIVELSDQGKALLPDLKAAWRQLADQTVAGMSSTPTGQLTDVLTDLAASLATPARP